MEKTITPKLWTMKDVQQYGSFRSRNKVYDAIRDGLPVIRTGRLIRFNPERVIEYFNSKEVAG